MPRISPGALAKIRSRRPKPAYDESGLRINSAERALGKVKPDSAAAEAASSKIGLGSGPGAFKRYVNEYVKTKQERSPKGGT